MTFHLHTLGSPTLHRPDRPLDFPPGKPLALLIYLAVTGKPVDRGHLARLFWPKADASRARHSVRQALSMIRKRLGEEPFADDDPVSLVDGLIRTDLAELEVAVGAGDGDRILELYGGAFLERFGLPGVLEWSHWVEEVRSRSRSLAAAGLAQAADVVRRAGEVDRGLGYLRRAVEIDPYAPAHHRALTEALLDARRYEEARAALGEAQRVLSGTEQAAELEPLAARVAEAVRGDEGRRERRSLLELEFVGRTGELGELFARWRGAVHGAGGLVFLDGQRGIGKTRLAEEFAGTVRAEGATVVTVRTSEADRAIQWGVVANLVKGLLPLRGAAGISQASDALLRRLVPSMAREEPLNGDHALEPAALADAVGDLVDAVAHEGPFLVFIDDLQWADAASTALLGRLAHQLRRERGLVLAAFRREALTSRQELVVSDLVTRRLASRVGLEGLTEETTVELIGLTFAFDDEAEAEVVGRRMHDVTDGNPLFLAELLRALHEQGLIVSGDDGLRFSAGLPSDIPLPATVRDVIESRFERLDGDAAAVAAALAGFDRPPGVDRLRTAVGLPEGPFARGLGELVRRDVVRWLDEDRVAFQHDQLHAVARRFFHPGPVRRWWRRSRVVMTGVTTALAIAVAWLLWTALGGNGPPPYGGGTIYVADANGLATIRVAGGPPQRWAVDEVSRRPPGGLASSLVPFRLASGTLAWLEDVPRPAGPDFRVWMGDSVVATIGGPGDDYFGSLSPDGRWVGYSSERTEAPTFAQDAFIARLDGSDARRVYRGGSHVHGPLFSPDGQRFVLEVRAGRDSAIVFSTDGERLATLPFEPGLGRVLGWCGPDRVLLTHTRADEVLLLWNPSNAAVRDLDHLEVGTRAACSPDGTALVHRVYDPERGFSLVVHDVATGAHRPLPATGRERLNARLMWVAERIAPVPVRLVVRGRPLDMTWGATVRPRAEVQYSDSSWRGAAVRWTSLDPGTVSVVGDGTLSANRPGRATLVASAGPALKDTVHIEVAADSAGKIQPFAEPFVNLDTTRWEIFGNPPPAVVPVDGRPALWLTGDEKWLDGIMTRKPLDVSRGVTVELDFRLTVTEDVYQNLLVCLTDGSVRRLAPGATELDQGTAACFRYPALDLDKMRPDEFAAWVTPGVASVQALPDLLPSDTWRHLAIQVRADGETTFFLQQRPVYRSPFPLPKKPDATWRLVLSGKSVGTRLLVRDLLIWPEPRFNESVAEGRREVR